MDTEKLTAWLKQAHYREATVQVTVRELGRVLWSKDNHQPIPEYCRNTGRRVLTYLFANPTEEVELKEFLKAQGLTPTTKKLQAKPQARKFEAISIDIEDESRFRDFLAESEEPVDFVISTMAVGGLRVGDALGIRRDKLNEGIRNGILHIERKGGRWVPVPTTANPDVWQRLYYTMEEANADTAAALLCPEAPSTLAGGAPYQQVRRRLQEIARELNIKGRMHTHRLRRTFATRIYGETEDIVVVAKSLNNGIQATSQYLNETNVGKIADLQKKIWGTK